MSFEINENNFRKTYKIQNNADKVIKNFKINLPYRPNLKTVYIVSFLTFDGHLTPNKKMFLFTAGNTKNLRKAIQFTKEEFRVTGKLKKVETNRLGTSYEYRICSIPIGRILSLLGTPDGNKVLKKFSVPKWIKESHEFSKMYVKTAFECEGSCWKEKDGRTRIAFRLNKEQSIIEDAFNFMNDIKKMLETNGIKTTDVWQTDSNVRKDGFVTKGVQFRIKSESNDDFINYFNFNKTWGRKSRGTNV